MSSRTVWRSGCSGVRRRRGGRRRLGGRDAARLVPRRQGWSVGIGGAELRLNWRAPLLYSGRPSRGRFAHARELDAALRGAEALRGDIPAVAVGWRVRDVLGQLRAELCGRCAALAMRAANLDGHLVPAVLMTDADRTAGVSPGPSVAPAHQRKQGWDQICALLGEVVLTALGSLLVDVGLEDSVVYERLEPVGEDIGRDPEIR